jgi:hypothetical protein
VTVNADTQSNSEYVTYQEAAKILNVSIHAIIKANAIGVFRIIRGSRTRVALIPRWEVEALVGKSVATRHAKELLDDLRARGVTTEKEYNEDGTPNWMGKSDLERVIAENNAVMEEVRQQMHALGDILLDMADGLSDEKLEGKVKSFLKRVVADA